MGFGTAGTSGNGTVNQNGGSVTFYSNAGTTIGGGSLVLGETGTGTYTYNLNGGTLTVPSINHSSGTAVFNFNGGVRWLLRPMARSLLTGLSSANVQAGRGLSSAPMDSLLLCLSRYYMPPLWAPHPDVRFDQDGEPVTLQLEWRVNLYRSHGYQPGPGSASGNIFADPGGDRRLFDVDNVNDNANGNGTGNPVTSGTLNSGDVIVNSGSGGTALNGVVNTADYVTVGSGASLTTGKFGNGLLLDGGGTSVDIPSQITAYSTGGANYTLVAAWWKPARPGGGAILSKNNGADTFNTGNSTYYLGTNPPPGAVGASSNYPVGVQNTGGFQGSGTPVVDGTFHLVTFCRQCRLHSHSIYAGRPAHDHYRHWNEHWRQQHRHASRL